MAQGKARVGGLGNEEAEAYSLMKSYLFLALGFLSTAYLDCNSVCKVTEVFRNFSL